MNARQSFRYKELVSYVKSSPERLADYYAWIKGRDEELARREQTIDRRLQLYSSRYYAFTFSEVRKILGTSVSDLRYKVKMLKIPKRGLTRRLYLREDIERIRNYGK